MTDEQSYFICICVIVCTAIICFAALACCEMVTKDKSKPEPVHAEKAP